MYANHHCPPQTPQEEFLNEAPKASSRSEPCPYWPTPSTEFPQEITKALHSYLQVNLSNIAPVVQMLKLK